MSIDRASVKLWSLLKEKGLLPRLPAVLEIGEANWFGDVLLKDVPEFEEVAGLDGLNLFELARVYYQLLLGYVRVDTIDAGGPGKFTHRLDLNEPLDDEDGIMPKGMRFNYDIVINTGTVEHVFDQRQVFETIHDRTAVGGLMVHAFPIDGCRDHGFYTHQPNLLAAIAEANRYEELAAVLSEGHGDKIVHLAWRKTRSDNFVVPQQGRCAGVNGGQFVPVEAERVREKIPHSEIRHKWIQTPTTETRQMTGITREELLKEQANLDQQKKAAEDTIAACQRVYQEAVNRLNSVGGALQIHKHLMDMLDKKEQGCEQPTDGVSMIAPCGPDKLTD